MLDLTLGLLCTQGQSALRTRKFKIVVGADPARTVCSRDESVGALCKQLRHDNQVAFKIPELGLCAEGRLPFERDVLPFEGASIFRQVDRVD